MWTLAFFVGGSALVVILFRQGLLGNLLGKDPTGSGVEMNKNTVLVISALYLVSEALSGTLHKGTLILGGIASFVAAFLNSWQGQLP